MYNLFLNVSMLFLMTYKCLVKLFPSFGQDGIEILQMNKHLFLNDS